MWKNKLVGNGSDIFANRERTAGVDALFNQIVFSAISVVQAGPVNGQASQFVTLNTNTYRGDGQRITKTEPGGSIKYVYQGGAVLYTLDASGNLINNHVNTPDGALISMMHERNGDTVTSSFSTDIRSSISMVLGDSNDYLTGFSYSDFGVTEKLEETQELLEVAYTGGIWDACTGLYYLNARYYNPVDARFLTLDTARNGGDIRATLSLYGYCEGDPINATDPSGLWAERYPNFKWIKNNKKVVYGFSVDMTRIFLSRPFCILYASDVLHQKGTWTWRGQTLAGMSRSDISVELFAHAVVYFGGKSAQKVINHWRLNAWVNSGKNAHVVPGDPRMPRFYAIWGAASLLKAAWIPVIL